jgi:hypothetical protein
MNLRIVEGEQLHRLWGLPDEFTAADVVLYLGCSPNDWALFTPGGLRIEDDHKMAAHAAGGEVSGELHLRRRDAA